MLSIFTIINYFLFVPSPKFCISQAKFTGQLLDITDWVSHKCLTDTTLDDRGHLQEDKRTLHHVLHKSKVLKVSSI